MEIEYRDARSSEQVRVLKIFTSFTVRPASWWWTSGTRELFRRKSHPRFTTHLCPYAFRTRPQGKNNCGVIREDQLAIGPVNHRSQCPRQKRERERPGDCHHALRRSSPLWTFSIREFLDIRTACFLRRIPQFHGDDKSRMVQYLRSACRSPKMTRTVTGICHGFPEEASEISDLAERRCGVQGTFSPLQRWRVRRQRKEERQRLESVMREHCLLPAKENLQCTARNAVKRTTACADWRERSHDDKTVFIIKRN